MLFLDEPNSGLDPVSSRQMDALIQELRDSIGVTVVMVTHDADSIFDILLLGAGGREHALLTKLQESPRAGKIHMRETAQKRIFGC